MERLTPEQFAEFSKAYKDNLASTSPFLFEEENSVPDFSDLGLCADIFGDMSPEDFSEKYEL
ncbi:MAG: hypothetical protein FWC00_03120 [Firmicutes bacterium]|nr:hypothetical protein [Bacillota bacterium]